MNCRYDVALSFAGENRQYVREVAYILKHNGVKVFYDEFEEASLWGSNLFVHLKNIYSEQANYTIIFCSSYYAEKLWTNHERESAQERAFRENKTYILPARFDDTKIPGLLDTISYIDLRELSPVSFCKIIAKKLGIKIISQSNKKEGNSSPNKIPSDEEQEYELEVSDVEQTKIDVKNSMSILSLGSKAESQLSAISSSYLHTVSFSLKKITQNLKHVSNTNEYIQSSIKKLILPGNFILTITNRRKERTRFLGDLRNILESYCAQFEERKTELLTMLIMLDKIMDVYIDSLKALKSNIGT